MFDETWTIDGHLLTRLAIPAKQMEYYFGRELGVRIGQSTVASQKMHTYSPDKPQEVQILQDVDAGQVFYRRQAAGQVYHLDVFHQCGLVDHRQAAKNVRQAVETYNLHQQMQQLVLFNMGSTGVNANLIDIQTGTGGGRITGDLSYGTKQSLRRAHENHVHIAAMIPKEHLVCLFYIVNSVETVIKETALELRCNERIIHSAGGGGSGADMTPYSDQSDSFMQEKGNSKSTPQPLRNRQLMQDAFDLGNQFDSAGEIKEVFEHLSNNPTTSNAGKYLEDKGAGKGILEQLTAMGLIETERNKVKLTEYGQEFYNFLKWATIDIDLRLRQSLRSVKPRDSRGSIAVTRLKPRRSGPTGKVQIWTPGETLGELAVADTVHAAAVRAAQNGEGFKIAMEDIRAVVRQQRVKSDICLIVDGSASMAGARIRAAKFLARHLLLASPDRISVIVFQDNRANIQVPLTRDFNQVEEKLSALTPIGSTPLSLGLTTCADYLKNARAVNPLIILITDGVPTVASHSRDPMVDALEAAASIKELNCGFICFGLKPHRDYLKQLAKTAGGRAHIFDELEKQDLIRAAWTERVQRPQ